MADVVPQNVRMYLSTITGDEHISRLERAVTGDVTAELQTLGARDIVKTKGRIELADAVIMRTDGVDGVAEIVRGVHDMLTDIKLTVTEQHVDGGIVRIAGILDATSQKTITGGFQYGQHVHLPIRLAIKVEDGRIVKLFESS